MTAYYEPFNERRGFDSSSRGDKIDTTYKHVADYWREYEGREMLGQYYRLEWISKDLLMEREVWEPKMQRYVEVLIEKTLGRPVLQFNRIDSRSPWFDLTFPMQRSSISTGSRENTSASGYWSVTAAGLLQFGPSKDHRPDLPQVKIMVAALDPLGMPVATDIVPGQRADDPLSIPAITRVREGLGRRGLLYVGDGKMGALETRASIHAGGDDYLCPLSEPHVPPAVLADYLAPVWTEEQALTRIHRTQPGGPSQLIAAGFARLEPVTAEVVGQPYRWRERRLVIRSCQWAQAAERGLRGRLAKAQAAITALQTRGRGRQRSPDPSALREAVEAILAR